MKEIPFTVDMWTNSLIGSAGPPKDSVVTVVSKRGSLPIPLCEGIEYFVIYDSFGRLQLSSTAGGHPIQFTTPGVGGFNLVLS